MDASPEGKSTTEILSTQYEGVFPPSPYASSLGTAASAFDLHIHRPSSTVT